MASEVLQLIHTYIQYLIRRSLSGVTAESDCSATELQLPPATTPHRVHTVHVYVLYGNIRRKPGLTIDARAHAALRDSISTSRDMVPGTIVENKGDSPLC